MGFLPRRGANRTGLYRDRRGGSLRNFLMSRQNRPDSFSGAFIRGQKEAMIDVGLGFESIEPLAFAPDPLVDIHYVLGYKDGVVLFGDTDAGLLKPSTPVVVSPEERPSYMFRAKVTDGEDTPDTLESVLPSIGRVAFCTSFRSDRLFDDQVILTRNSGTQSSTGIGCLDLRERGGRTTGDAFLTDVGDHSMVFSRFFTEYYWTLRFLDAPLDFWGEGVSYTINVSGLTIENPGWDFRPETKSYLLVTCWRRTDLSSDTETGQGRDDSGGIIVDLDGDVGFVLDIADRRGSPTLADALRFRLKVNPTGFATFIHESDGVVGAEGDVITAGLWWDHETKDAYYWYRVNDGTPVSGSQNIPNATDAENAINRGFVGFRYDKGPYFFTGMIEFDDGVPANIEDAMEWHADNWPSGNKAWYPQWRQS